MKRLIAAGILLVVVIASYLLSLFYIDDTCDKINELVTLCEKQYEISTDDAYKTAKKLENEWSQKEQILSFFVNHDRIDDIELTIASMKVYSKRPDNDIFYEYSGQIKMQLHQLREDCEISTHSIF